MDFPYLAKTEISEIAPRPCTVTFGLLKKIYAEHGPVDRVYKKYGVRYSDTDFLVIVGNELFIDKEKEIHSLLPSYSYAGSKTDTPSWKHISGSLTTIKNVISLNRISPDNYQELRLRVLDMLARQFSQSKNVEQILSNFFQDYETIFAINLMSGIAMKRLQYAIAREPISMAQILRSSSLWVKEADMMPPSDLVGNSLDIADETLFMSHTITHAVDIDVDRWWNNLPAVKKSYVEKKIIQAVSFSQLREQGRWVTVSHISHLRATVLAIAKEKEFAQDRCVYFASVEEIISGNISEAACVKRQRDYREQSNITTAPTSQNIRKNKSAIGLASGISEGTLCSVSLLEEKSLQGSIILYTDSLDPTLTTYFDRITGIVSESGGLLSHIAIVAREAGIPVLVANIAAEGIVLGDHILINGGTGEIRKKIDNGLDRLGR